MRLVVAIGGNALLVRGETPMASIQRRHVEEAARALAPIGREHELLITHGNGPQVGLLAAESERDPSLPTPYPLDVIGAQTQGMIGYLLLQALHNAHAGSGIVSLVTQTVVAADDPAFRDPSKFVGRILTAEEADRASKSAGWDVRRDGASWRRVVASPSPTRVVELDAIAELLSAGMVVVCAGGGGIPVIESDGAQLTGVEAVIDKDKTAGLLAEHLGADALVILTDVANVQIGFGTNHAEPIGRTTPAALRALRFPPGSMGPKVAAACDFVEATSKPAMIGALGDVAGLLARSSGTVIEATTGDHDVLHPFPQSEESIQ